MHFTEIAEIRYQSTAQGDSVLRLAFILIPLAVLQQRRAHTLDDAVNTVSTQNLHDRHVNSEFCLQSASTLPYLFYPWLGPQDGEREVEVGLPR